MKPNSIRFQAVPCAAVVAALIVCTLAAPTSRANAQSADFDQGRYVPSAPEVLEQRDRPAVINRILADRLDNLLPTLMRETGIDMWVIINREYNEDPVFFSLVPAPVFAARRTTMLVFFDRGEEEGVERLTVNRYPYGSLYESAWEGGNLDEQWQGLAEVIAARDPKTIAVNRSRDWPVADGLSAALYDRLMEALPDKLDKRVTSAEKLVVRWIETRSQEELEVFPHIVSIARGVISEAFSNRVITPGATTVNDVVWYIRQRFSKLELPIWFQPSVDVQRLGDTCENNTFCGRSGDTVIERGDVLHTDVGICYLRLCTDNQEMGYVLRFGEDGVPQDLEDALDAGNRWQDLLTSSYVTGRSGNEILAETIKKAESEGLATMTYTHPLGVFGHSVGPTIGMWDNQGDTPVRGDWPLYPMTSYAIEGNAAYNVPSWDNQKVLIKLEQGAVFDGERVIYLGGRQTEWHVVE